MRKTRRTTVGKATLATIFFALGIMLGYVIAYWQHTNPPLAGPTSTSSTQKNKSTATQLAQYAVTVKLFDNNNNALRTTTGALLDNGLIVLALTDLFNAYHATVDINNITIDIDSIKAINKEALLVMVNPVSPVESSLIVAEDGALFLGREIYAVSKQQKISGQVATAAQQTTNGHAYGIELSKPLTNEIAAVVSQEQTELAGFILQRTMHNTRSYYAVDAQAINSMLNTPLATPLDLATLNQGFFNQDSAGLTIALKYAQQNKAWQQVINISKQLLQQGSYPAELLSNIANEAFNRQIQNFIQDQRFESALDYIEDANSLLNLNASRAQLHAEALYQQGSIQQAITTLFAAIDYGLGNTAITEQLRAYILNAGRNNQASPELLITLLEQAISREPSFALYHAEQGRLLFKQSRYGEALSSFNYATQLDPNLTADLQGIMNAARQRLSTPDRTVVPITPQGNALYVDVLINNQAKRFILDTGASYTAISASTANSLGLTDLDLAPQISLSTGNGKITAPVIQVDSINLNGAEVRNLRVVVLQAVGNIDGLLGLNFLNHFNMDINQAAGQIILSRR